MIDSQASGRMTRVVVADDHALMRRTIRIFLDSAAGIEVVGEASDGVEAVAMAQQMRPDLIVMDVSMPKLDGITAAKQIQGLSLPTLVVIISMHATKYLVEEALQAGARGYVSKRRATADLLPAIERVQQGDIFLSNGLMDSPLDGA